MWDLKTSGRLTQPVTVTIPLTQEVPADAQVWLATRSDTSEQWEYLPGTLSADRQTVSAQVEHFSLFTAHLISVPAIVEWIKKDWLSGISQGVLHKAASPGRTDHRSSQRLRTGRQGIRHLVVLGHGRRHAGPESRQRQAISSCLAVRKGLPLSLLLSLALSAKLTFIN